METMETMETTAAATAATALHPPVELPEPPAPVMPRCVERPLFVMVRCPRCWIALPLHGQTADRELHGHCPYCRLAVRLPLTW